MYDEETSDNISRVILKQLLRYNEEQVDFILSKLQLFADQYNLSVLLAEQNLPTLTDFVFENNLFRDFILQSTITFFSTIKDSAVTKGSYINNLTDSLSLGASSSYSLIPTELQKRMPTKDIINHILSNNPWVTFLVLTHVNFNVEEVIAAIKASNKTKR